MPGIELTGIVAILVTPLTDAGQVDEAGVRHLVDYCCEQGFSGLVVLGSNGEFPYLSFEEKVKVITAAADQAKGRIKVIAGASDYSTDQAIALTVQAREAGCDAVMAALPAYFKLGIDNVLLHIGALVDQGGLPVYFYHFPETTGLVLTPAEISRIAEIEGVVGAKFTVTSIPFLKEVIGLTRDMDFRAFIGTSFLLRDCLELGGAGVFCPLPLLGPQDVKAIAQAQQSGDTKAAIEAQDKVLAAVPLFAGVDLPPEIARAGFKAMAQKPLSEPLNRSSASHAMVKEALRLKGHPIGNMVKRPYLPVSKEQSELVEKTLAGLGWLE